MILLHVKCKESSAVIKFQMVYTGVSLKNRGKNCGQGFWQGTEKIEIVWDLFWENGDEVLVLSIF